MARLIIKTPGLESLIKNIRNVQRIMPGGPVGKAVSGLLKRTLDDVGKKVIKTLQEETPVGDPSSPGYHVNSQFHKSAERLKDSWKWELKMKGSVIEGSARVKSKKLNNLVDLLQAGSPPHRIAPKTGSTLRFYVREGGGWKEVYKKAVSHPGFVPNRFVDRSKEKVEKYVGSIIDAVNKDFNRIITGKR